MSSLTVTLPDDLAERLRPQEDRLSEILELGLRELNADPNREFREIAQVLEFLAALPSPEDILDLRPSDELQSKIQQLLEKNRAEHLSPEEEAEWEKCAYLEHLVRLAKTNALVKLNPSGNV